MVTEIKLYKVTSVSYATEPNAVFFVKPLSSNVVTTYITDINGIAIPLKDLSSGSSGITNITSTDGTIEVTGLTTKNIQISSALQSVISSALQSSDPVSSLINDAGYITIADIPIFNPGDYDLEDFTNTSSDPFVRQSEVDNFLDDKVDKVTGKSLIDDTEITRLATVTNFDNSGNITALGNKVDKVVGKQLSTEDYTTTEKSKLAGIQAGAEVNVNADWNAIGGDSQILNKPTIPSIAGLATETYVDAKVEDTIVNGVTTIAPSQNTVFNALALKQNSLTWVDYSALTITVGWSSFSQKRLWYLDFGSHILLYYHLVGNGSGINSSFTAPFNATQESWCMHIPMINGTIANNPGRGVIASGSNIVNLYATLPGSTWSAGASTKIASGIIIYKK